MLPRLVPEKSPLYAFCDVVGVVVVGVGVVVGVVVGIGDSRSWNIVIVIVMPSTTPFHWSPHLRRMTFIRVNVFNRVIMVQ